MRNEMIASATQAMNALTGEERIRVMGQFCKYCGIADPHCNCYDFSNIPEHELIVTRRVLDGEQFKDLAPIFGVSIATLRGIVFRTLRILNEKAFLDGCVVVYDGVINGHRTFREARQTRDTCDIFWAREYKALFLQDRPHV